MKESGRPLLAICASPCALLCLIPCSVLHVNGIAVYVEEQDADGEGGAIMVSAIVRAPTADVFRVRQMLSFWLRWISVKWLSGG